MTNCEHIEECLECRKACCPECIKQCPACGGDYCASCMPTHAHEFEEEPEES